MPDSCLGRPHGMPSLSVPWHVEQPFAFFHLGGASRGGRLRLPAPCTCCHSLSCSGRQFQFFQFVEMEQSVSSGVKRIWKIHAKLFEVDNTVDII